MFPPGTSLSACGRSGSRDRGDGPGRVPGQMERRDALEVGWLRVAGAVAVTVGVFPSRPVHYNVQQAEAVAGWPRWWPWRSSPMVLWMRRPPPASPGNYRAGMSRALETGALAVGDAGVSGAIGREVWRPGAVRGGLRRSRTRLAAGRVCLPGWRWRSGSRLGHVRRGGPHQPRQFFTHTGVFLIVVAAGIH